MIKIILCIVVVIITGYFAIAVWWNRHVSLGVPVIIGKINLGVEGNQIDGRVPVVDRPVKLVLVSNGDDFNAYKPCDNVPYSGMISIEFDGEVWRSNNLVATNWFDPKRSCVILFESDINGRSDNISIKVDVGDIRYGVVTVYYDPVNK